MPDTTRRPLVPNPILVVGPESRFQRALILELRSLSAPVLCLDSLAIGATLPTASTRPPSVLLLPEEEVDTDRFESDLAELRIRTTSPQLVPIAFGRAPDPERRLALRQAGIDLALFGRFGRHALRFQINRALSSSTSRPVRGAMRAPQEWRTRTYASGKAKTVRCYSLSAGGAYFVTPRPFVAGSRIAFELPVGRDRLLLDGRILYTNVAGSDDRSGLPGGMAVAFSPISEHIREVIRQGVTASQQGLQV